MGNDISKIERKGFAPRVLELLNSGVITGTDVAKALRADGLKISDDAVRVYLRKIKPEINTAAAQIIKKHVDATVPADMKALESMESQCLVWFNELPIDQAQRLAAAAVDIDEELSSWIKIFEKADSTSKKKIIKKIIQECLLIVNRDARQQDKRLKALLAAVKIIDLKLGKAGLLEDDGRGRILIVNRKDEYVPYDPTNQGERKPLTVVMNDD